MPYTGILIFWGVANAGGNISCKGAFPENGTTKAINLSFTIPVSKGEIVSYTPYNMASLNSALLYPFIINH